MANFEGKTVSYGFAIDAEQKAALDEILKKYEFSMEDVSLGDDSEFGIWGYDWLNVLAADRTDDDWDDVSEKLFEDIRPILKAWQNLVVICIGNEKLRYASAMKITVTPEKVEFLYIG